MAEKFDYDEHMNRMRELLKPKPLVQGNDLVSKFREIAKRRKAPSMPTAPTVKTREIIE